MQRTSAAPARTRARTWVETCASSILFVTRPLLACLVLELTGPYTATCLPGLTRRRRGGRAAACLAYQSDTARKAAKKRNAALAEAPSPFRAKEDGVRMFRVLGHRAANG